MTGKAVHGRDRATLTVEVVMGAVIGTFGPDALPVASLG